MLKVDIPLITDLIVETWKLVFRTKSYLEDWKVSFLTPIFKKGDSEVPMNYSPVCMLSCIRKVIESAIADRILKETQIGGRKFGFQRVLSFSVTLLNVDAVVRAGRNISATLDLSKAVIK